MPKKNSKHLTDPGIDKISKAKKGKRVERFDAGVPGLCLRVTDRGVKTWAVYYKFPGINRKGEPALLNQRLTIGQWPGVRQVRGFRTWRCYTHVRSADAANVGILPYWGRKALTATRPTRESADPMKELVP